MKSKVIKAIIICIVVVGIGGAGYFGYNKFFKKSAAVTSSKYSTSTVKKMSISKTIQGTGAAYAGTTYAVAPNNNGIIADLTVKVGDTVTAGQKLFVSSSSDLTKAVTTATRNLTKAKAQLAADESSLTTAKTQLTTDESADKVDATKVASDEKSISDTNSKISDDGDSVSDATTALSDANTALTKQTVTSPIAGLVTSVDNANGDSGQSGKSAVTVTDMNSMKVKVSVDELDISSVTVGQKATIKFDALSDKSFTGSVESVAQTGTTSNNVTTYDVVVSISNPTGIKLGMNADVTIAVQSKDNAIVIPEEALVESNSKKYVRVEDTTKSNNMQSNNNSSNATSNSKLVEITTGLETEDYIEVTKGVTEGETILVQLPSSSSSTNTQQGGMGGPGGSMGSGGGMPSGGGQGGGQSSSNSKSTSGK
ncbi:HlyD family secretion protein [Clostridium acidisoli DSM 12555]|uniref:HlyD family secretion protein n=1 Tax=Clostridium acidisoli DSM 12555 TaxID=1121291 RepID=A0A1W1XSZ5_9CLOT|nr:efflux RND transporter periplasmic adaptor subunit [Clostridium acidisoli]SMC26972.1 HlyD family secretion protein [Clostridium acidisoli DSM 12555]